MSGSGTLGGGDGGPLIAGFCIPIRHQMQHETNACWATCLAMVFKWAGVDQTKEEIFIGAPNIIPEYRYNECATLAETNFYSKKVTDGKVTFTKISQENVRSKDTFFWIEYINKFKPVLFSLNNHCRILVGYNGIGQLLCMDPAGDYSSQPAPIGIRTFQSNTSDAWAMN